MTGRTISHYRVEEKLGQGGMGVVYRALDTRLNRPVAIKVLPTDATADPERKKRFVQEARAASALNHPNIVTIHDIDSVDGVDFIVMEYVAGRSLDRVISRSGLSLSESLQYAVQVADALATAHAAGIVHRDIKPANIMVTDKGQVKILDFGLAKLSTSEDGSGSTLDEAPLTEKGAILGTVAYMSPEQAEGRPLDARTDIFSFGSVLYEMLTGRRPFQGETRMSTITAILRDEPKPVTEVAEGTPRELERIISYCLRKDPRRRFRHMDDIKIALEGLKEESDSGRLLPPATGATGRPKGRAARRWAAAATVVVGLLGGLAWWMRRSPAPAPEQQPLRRLTFDSGLTTEPALSPDGRILAYASDRAGEGNLDIWVQHLSGGGPVRLTRGSEDESQPDFSPDGGRVAFRSEHEGGGIYLVPTLGGEPRLLVRDGRRPRFSPDGSQIAYWVGSLGAGVPDGRIFVVPAGGGTPRQVQPDLFDCTYPIWSPDGKYLLFRGTQGQSFDWWLAPVAGGAAQKTGAATVFQRHGLAPRTTPGAWLAGDRIVFSAQSGGAANLWQISLSPGTWQAGDAQRVTFGTGLEEDPSAASDGSLVFASHTSSTNIWSLPMDHRQGKVTGAAQRLTQGAATNYRPTLSEDGTKLAFLSNRTGNFDVWWMDLVSGKETALTATPVNEQYPTISPDGTRVAFYLLEGGKYSIFVAPAAGGAAEKVCDNCGRTDAWSPDGKRILFLRSPAPFRIGSLDLDSGRQTDLLGSTIELTSPDFSHDGRWIVFRARNNPLTRRVYAVEYRGERAYPESGWLPITDGKGLDREPRWSPEGNLVYFLSERDGFGCIWAQRLDAATKRPVGSMFPVQHLHNPRLSLGGIQNTGLIGLSPARGRLALALGERTGNIWMKK